MERTNYQIEIKLAQLITADQAYHYRIVPHKNKNEHVRFLTDTEDIHFLKNELEILLDFPLEIEFCDTKRLEQYLNSNYRLSKNTIGTELHYTTDFLEKVLLTAKSIGSSDIHFEPYEENCRIRYRLDGKLIEQYQVPIREYPTIINKIKIKAGLDISEKRLPQDGRISMVTKHTEFDIRVSSLPTLHGEKIVLRLLSKDSGSINLTDLGLTDKELKTYKDGIKNPHGIVLISGPTGSGKTTTLYATLKLLNETKTNILTIEDPIEYTLEGINQVQLKENIGLDFTAALRTFLRQDPDIIMVGEIRDVKTANMAIRAALTGHLVLSTIHTNSAWGTISRLIDMGVPPFLIASTLNLSVAQRLVRKLCTKCKKEQAISKDVFPQQYVIPKKITTHTIAQGCNHCYHTGYSGRKAIYEIIPVTKKLVNHIKNNELQIDDYLKNEHITTLKQTAEQLIIDGTTSIDEVYALLTE